MSAPETGMTALHLQVPKDHIFYLRFLLEGYEGLAVQTSRSQSPFVTWLVPNGLLDQALELLEALGRELGVSVLSLEQAADRGEDSP